MQGICHIEPLFHATIEGRKLMTRRIITPQPTGDLSGSIFFTRGRIDTPQPPRILQKFDFTCGTSVTPRYQVGDVLYLKEPYYDYGNGIIWYKFNNDGGDMSWSNKQSMPATAARYFTRITAIRAERLQDISDEDCFKEGVRDMWRAGYPSEVFGWDMDSLDSLRHRTPRAAYAALIDQITGRGTWDSNPWVLAYSFDLCEKPQTNT